MIRSSSRILVVVPAYNEEATIASVVQRLREAVPEFDLLVVNDGSSDRTGAILAELGVRTATHPCNIGYGRSIQTAIKYALRYGYRALITHDADGQHRPEVLKGFVEDFRRRECDLLIGSRFVATGRVHGGTLTRRLGMRAFSMLLKMATGRRVYDTSSGLRALSSRACRILAERPFVDFHAEAIAYLTLAGCTVGEYPVTVDERRHGTSMYSALAAVKYPVKNLILIVLAVLDARLHPPDEHDD
ncbi:MAG: glycosyl transferase family 2 [Acidobacteria bacterium]|nr:MAG: glycosyl transferase family 2 [Acidobacteriota bacterium]